MKEGVQLYHTCPINTITTSASNYFVYVKVKLGIHTILLFMKASKTQVYSEYGISHDICIELMAPLLGQGYHLFTDNWYTAVPLAESLLLEGTNLTGPVHSNRKYLPGGVKKKLAKGETVAFRKNRLLCMGWQDKKHVIVISTEGSSKMITYTSK